MAGLIGVEARNRIPLGLAVADTASTVAIDDRKGLDEWEEKLQEQINRDDRIQETERVALIKSRRGQGTYRQELMKIEKCCRRF